MVCGCFGAGKVGDLYKVKGIFNKEGYQSILQHHAIPCGQRLIRANFLLQQDNDPKHTYKLCKKYVGKKQSAGILSHLNKLTARMPKVCKAVFAANW